LGFCFGIQEQLVFFEENGIAFFNKNDKVPSTKMVGLNSSTDRTGSDPTVLIMKGMCYLIPVILC